MTANSMNSVPQIHHTKDYLGNIRNVLAKKDGVVQEVQHTAYFPFGGIIADLSSGRGVQNRFYNGKELDYANNLYWYDYGARQYDPTRGQFTTPDPLAEKYYGWNMYGYCMNNPVRFIDPDGRLIVFAEGSSDDFKEQFQQAINYLKENGCGEQYEILEKSETVFTITQGERNSYYKQNITWAPQDGLLTNDSNNFLSPSTLLNHEIGHGVDYLNDTEGYASKTKLMLDNLYMTKSDEYVILNIETPTAQSLGEVKPGSPSREDHGGIPYKTVSPVSNEPLDKVFKEMWNYK